MRRRSLVISLLAPTLAACTSISGFSGSSNYACKAPEGVACDSVSGTYANALQNNLPGQRKRAGDTTMSVAGATTSSRSQVASQPLVPMEPPAMPVALRSAPRILRLWFKPWEDADHDLYDQGYVYVQIDEGQWQIDHVTRQIRESFAPLKTPPRASGTAGLKSPAPPSSASIPPGFPSSRPQNAPLRAPDARASGAAPRDSSSIDDDE